MEQFTRLKDSIISTIDKFSSKSKMDITVAGYDAAKEVSKQMFIALKDPESKEVYNYLLEYGYISENSLNLEKIYRHYLEFSKEVTIKGGVKKGGGKISLHHCIVIGLFILISSMTFFLLKKRSEEGWYAINCTNIDLLLATPNDRSKVDTFFNNLHIIWQMSVNPAQFEQCKKVQEKRTKYVYDIVSYFQSQTDFWSVVKHARNLTLFMIAFFSNGLKGLVCLAASASSVFIGVDVSLCNVECNKMKGINITTEKSKKQEQDEEEDEEDEE